MSFMDSREEKIIKAAIAVFVRYGVKRTTMNDIANEAGLVRQTLYTVYANKEEVMRAAIRWHADHALATIEAECADVDALGDQLDIVFKHLVIKPFEELMSTPHADDIVHGLNEAAREEIDQAEARYIAALETLFAPYEKQIRARGMSPGQLADLVENSCVGFKHKAKTKKHLLELLASLKALVLHSAGQA